MHSGLLAALAAAALAALPVAADAAGTDRLVGRWSGGGEQMGRPSQAELEVAPALGGRFLELSYRVTSPIRFEGRGLYRLGGDGVMPGRWFDSRGIEMRLVGRWEGDSLVGEWGEADKERGRTRYTLQGDGSLEVVDEVAGPDGSYRVFARQRLVRSR